MTSNSYAGMDSAPKDATPILAYVPNKHIWMAVHWRRGWSDWYSMPGEYAVFPSHWMPMPDRPGMDAHRGEREMSRYGTLHLDGYSGRSSTRVEIVGETPKRYRVRAITQTRTAGRLVYLEPGQIALVPKQAITLEAS
jgi:hypothetical protein